MDLNTQPKVAIVVLNWNGWEDTIECLESLFQIYYDNFQVIVVDNGSADGSIEKIKQWADGKILVGSKYFKFDPLNKPIKYFEITGSKNPTFDEKSKLILIRSEVNLGYAKGNNLGIKYATANTDANHILLLNNDTVVKTDFLNNMIKVYAKYPNAVLAGPKILDYYTGRWLLTSLKGRIGMLTTIMFFTPLKAFLLAAPFSRIFSASAEIMQKVYSISGCCMLFNRSVLDEIGLIDENTFLGWEEYIVAEKLFKRGLPTYYVPESTIYHKVGSSTARLEAAEKAIKFLESERYFQENYLKPPYIQRAVIAWIRLSIYAFISLFQKQYRENFEKLSGIIRSMI